MELSVISLIPLTLLSIVFGQDMRTPPGVPPQQYQMGHQQMPQQVPMHHQQMQMQHQQVPVQHQQVPMQHQQVPMQHQQVPMQHQQMPVQHQQVPMQHQQMPVQQQVPMQMAGQPPQPHHHGAPQQILNAAHIMQEKDHIKEHMDVPIDTSNMSDQELQFHYFKMHDADNNNKLDGCELIKSLIHWHEQGHDDPSNALPQEKGKVFSDKELVSLIDPILSMDDTNRDGFIDYPEFVRAQQKAAAGGGPPPSPAGGAQH
ncbi:probable basic-leucine zipper transcription factor I [Ischnura elegans]|uniref:probable basic-leucine zipper transcription factor I n=1 Tax=Ischnura elegans TaxID=197161 RepID=UPI001ED87A97|nr:probable basic-leucine zipper transcription factor I [Ischnura elegans]XP_046389140.1 probable basic-leucine zipper transcription factor I [Ischnura elegans]